MITSLGSSLKNPWLAATLALGATLRLYGLAHDLPFVYNPDEANILARALSVARDPNPHYFLYPSFYFYLLFAWLGGLFVLGRSLGRYESLAGFERRFFDDPTDFYLAGRFLGVLAALATIVLTYRLAERRYGRTAAGAAAFFLAVAYVHVRDAHYLKHDVPVALLVLVSLSCFDRVLERGSGRDYFFAGAAMGVAFATHYYTIFLAPALLACHFVRARLRELGRLGGAAATSAGVFFLLSPFVLLNFSETLAHLKENRLVVMDRSFASGALLFPTAGFYLRLLAEQCWGYPLFALVLVGAVLLARRGVKDAVLWGGFTIPFLLFLSFTFGAGRYLNPVLPGMAVAAGVAVGRIRYRGAAVLLASLWPLYLGIQVDRLFAGDDTRTLARDWILEHGKVGGAVALQSYSVPLPQTRESLIESLTANRAEAEIPGRGKFSHLASIAESRTRGFRLYFIGRGDEKDRIYFDYEALVSSHLAPLRARGVAFVALRHSPGAPARVEALFEEVRRQSDLAARFLHSEEPSLHPYLDNEDWPPLGALARKGPLVEVWSLEKR